MNVYALTATVKPVAETPEDLVAQVRAAVDRFKGESDSAQTRRAISAEVMALLHPHRGGMVPPNIRVDVTGRSGEPWVDVVDVDEERERAELWMRFFEAWLGVPRERIIYDGDPLP
jgi:hypothetical protein